MQQQNKTEYIERNTNERAIKRKSNYKGKNKSKSTQGHSERQQDTNRTYGDMKIEDRAKTRAKTYKQQKCTNTIRQAQNKGTRWEQAYARARAKAKNATQAEQIETGNKRREKRQD
jgi:hypothetical protein